MRREFWASAGGLWVAQGAHKLAVLAFSVWVGRSLGSEGVGVMAATLAVCWVVGNVAGMGLTDRAVFDGAASHRPGALYGWFLLLGGFATCALYVSAEWVAQVDEPGLVALARGLVLGAGLQGLSAVGLGWLRGASRPQAEIWGTLGASVVLLMGVALPEHLGLVWAASGGCFLVASWVGNQPNGGLRPQLPIGIGLGAYLRQTWAYWALGLGSWLLGNADVLAGRVFLPASELGHLQVGTMVVRGLALVPWIAASLMLRDCQRRWSEGTRPTPVRWSSNGLMVGAIASGLAWLLLPFLARGHGMIVAAVSPSATASMVIAPVFYAQVLLVQLAAQWHLGRTLRALLMGLMVQISVVWVLRHTVSGTELVVAAGVGQLVALLWLVQALRAPRHQGVQVDLGAGGP